MMGVGMPEQLKLLEFGGLIWDAFGCVAYHVGSSLLPKHNYRDVDVRVLLPDNRYSAEYGDPNHPHQNARWVATVLAFTVLGQQITGLPIDFQIQEQTYANLKFSGIRSALIRLWTVTNETTKNIIRNTDEEVKVSDNVERGDGEF